MDAYTHTVQLATFGFAAAAGIAAARGANSLAVLFAALAALGALFISPPWRWKKGDSNDK